MCSQLYAGYSKTGYSFQNEHSRRTKVGRKQLAISADERKRYLRLFSSLEISTLRPRRRGMGSSLRVLLGLVWELLPYFVEGRQGLSKGSDMSCTAHAPCGFPSCKVSTKTA